MSRSRLYNRYHAGQPLHLFSIPFWQFRHAGIYANDARRSSFTLVEDRPTPRNIYNWRLYATAIVASVAALAIGYDSTFIGATAVSYYSSTLFASISWSGTPWILTSEIFCTSKSRAFGQSHAAFQFWFWNFIFSRFLPNMFSHMGKDSYGVFFFFASVMLVSLGIVWKAIPDTRAVVLEDMDGLFEIKPARKANELMMQHGEGMALGQVYEMEMEIDMEMDNRSGYREVRKNLNQLEQIRAPITRQLSQNDNTATTSATIHPTHQATSSADTVKVPQVVFMKSRHKFRHYSMTSGFGIRLGLRHFASELPSSKLGEIGTNMVYNTSTSSKTIDSTTPKTKENSKKTAKELSPDAGSNRGPQDEV
ncbi:hypothetical protein CERZMDRAFT_103022 [Cercospora zeae-maydis SCOH1-5]|uniref:Major facilitator superfamily (MFS) profile domain-containing protein n=1 Tax=Cercospora zeae-maydis SCOH1-5 TaxID=717836 RepID=A0A6A6EZ21_9PEZI|nr:hypothetical protein CERZMDRAFT_103022 [Cercospora zeae-maydis SCOH1-5]